MIYEHDYIDPEYRRIYGMLCLFLGIVWRIDMSDTRMSISLAWSVATSIYRLD